MNTEIAPKWLKKSGLASIAFALICTAAIADGTPTLALDLTSMPAKSVWNGLASITPLAFNSEKKPSVVVLRLPAGTVADSPHATSDGQVRFATVLRGTMYFADGEAVDKAKEVAYPQGSVLLISSGTKHWLSAHDGDVTVMLTAVQPENLSPPVLKQAKP